VANSNIGNPHYQPTANGPVRARRFSVVSSPRENGFVKETQVSRGRRQAGSSQPRRAFHKWPHAANVLPSSERHRRLALRRPGKLPRRLMPAGARRRGGGSGTQCQSATCSAEPEEHATMLVTLGTLVAGLAVVAVAFQGPMAAVAPGCRRLRVL